MESKVAKAGKVHDLVNSEEQAVSASRKPQIQSLGTQTSCLVEFSCEGGAKFERAPVFSYRSCPELFASSLK